MNNITKTGPSGDRRTWRTGRLATLLLAGLLVGLPGLGCDSTDGTADPEKDRAVTLLLTRTTDVNGVCVQALGSALSCASSAGTVTVTLAGTTLGLAATTYYATYLETVYGFTASSPKGATELCAQLSTITNYPVPGKSNSEGVKICNLNCEKAVWDRAIAGGVCTSTGYLTLTSTITISGQATTAITLTNDSAFQTCLDDCLVRGTVLP